MPLDYLLSLVRDVDLAQEIRIDAAKAAAPFCHPRLAAIAVAVAGDTPDPDERRARVLGLLGIGGDPADTGAGEDLAIEAEAVDVFPGDGAATT